MPSRSPIDKQSSAVNKVKYFQSVDEEVDEEVDLSPPCNRLPSFAARIVSREGGSLGGHES